MSLRREGRDEAEVSRDAVVLRGIQAMGRHGVLDFEREAAQPFEVDVEISLDLAPAAESDDLANTVDYGAVVQAVVSAVEAKSFGLIEALAGAIAADLLDQTRAEEVTVEVRKMRPPVQAHLASAGVRISRRRS